MSKLPSGVACVGCSSGGSGALVRLAVLVLLAVAVASATAQIVPRSVPGQMQESDEAPAQTSPIEGVGYTQGSDGARLEVVELLDFGCSVCAAFAAQSYPVLRDRYVLAGEVRWRAIPFVLGSFRRFSEAARAAACAHDQGAFWEMHDLLFARRGEWTAARSAESVFLELAGQLGLDGEGLGRCYRSDEARDRVDAQTRAARRLRVRGTPTFLIGEETVVGALSAEEFGRRIEAQLGR